MEAFKYALDKSSKKYCCPSCNKNTFVIYTDVNTGDILNHIFGRCDREQNCNYHKAPPKGKRAFLIDFKALKQISDKAYKLTDVNGFITIVPKSQILNQSESNCWITEWFLKSSVINYLSAESKYFNTDEVCIINEVLNVSATKPKPSFHTLELLDKMYFANQQTDNFTMFLKSKFRSDEVFNAMQNYFITGTNKCWNNTTVFWQINANEQIQGAKMMLFDRLTGKRIKEPYNHINWLHKAIKEPDFVLAQCLFGLHRINEDYLKTIAIVESEKTAIMMSIFLPDFIWLATGSKANFKFELLEPIKHRCIIAFPDKGEFKNWQRKAENMRLQGVNIAVSELLEQTEFESGFDLADYYLLQ